MEFILYSDKFPTPILLDSFDIIKIASEFINKCYGDRLVILNLNCTVIGNITTDIDYINIVIKLPKNINTNIIEYRLYNDGFRLMKTDQFTIIDKGNKKRFFDRCGIDNKKYIECDLDYNYYAIYHEIINSVQN